MLNVFWKSLLISPAILGSTLAISSGMAQANPQDPNAVLKQVENYSLEGQSVVNQDQVTSVNELRDVEPTAWAYEALRSLVEKYGCIVGYPDQTFRGNRALTRWEFAAGLNACMNKMEELIQQNVAILKEDIDKLKKLMQEFEAELAALGARVDNLEARVSFLEDHQFSTTTKLAGEVIFAVTTLPGNKNGYTNQAVLQDRVRLNFNTSFTGQDRLVTRLAAGSADFFRQNNSTILYDQDGRARKATTGQVFNPLFNQTFNATPSTDNNVAIDWLAYYTPIKLGENFRANTFVAAWGGQWYDFVPTLNPYFQDFDGGNGSLSSFSQQNPIYRIGGGGGIGASFQLGFLSNLVGPTSLSLGYLAGNANDPTPGNGLFNGNYGGLAQINGGGRNFQFGLTYVNAYLDADSPIFGNGGSFDQTSSIGLAGTSLANLSQTNLRDSFLAGTIDGTSASQQLATSGTLNGDIPFAFDGKSVNAYGVQAAWKAADWISISAFGTYATVRAIGAGGGEIWTYGGGLAFPDLGRQGNLLGLFAGVQPYFGITDGNFISPLEYRTINPIHIEAFYKFQVTDNISLTPGVIYLTNSSQGTFNTGNNWIGTLRGTFTF